VIARVLRVDVPPDKIDAIVDRYRQIVRPIHVQAAGLRKHYVEGKSHHRVGRGSELTTLRARRYRCKSPSEDLLRGYGCATVPTDRGGGATISSSFRPR
jgi:hypothetical protein